MTAAPNWTIPGYVADQLVGAGALGEVWSGRSLGGAAAVTLERLGPVDADTVETIRLRGRLPAGGHPYLLPVRDLVVTAGETVLVRDRAAGGSLATVLVHGGRLPPGEVATVVASLASALARAHSAGLVHGAVTPERVVFDLEGRPMLTGMGVDLPLGAAEPARLPRDHLDPVVAAGGAPSPETDVFMLASTGLAALDGSGKATGPSAVALRAVLRPAVEAEPFRRPTAAELAAGVRDACRPEPVRLFTPDSEPHPERIAVPTEPVAGTGRHGHRRRSGALGRRVGAGLVAALVVLVAGVVWSRSPTVERPLVPPPVAAKTSPAATPWLRVLDGLDEVRGTAYEKGNVAMLARVWVPGPRLQADAAQLRSLLSSGCTARGVRHRFDDVDVLAVAGQRVRLRVTQWLPASQCLRGGQVVGELTGSPAATVPVELVATDTGWRLG